MFKQRSGLGPWLAHIALALTGLFVLIPIWGLLNLALDAKLAEAVPLELHLWPQEPTLGTFWTALTHPAQSASFIDLLTNSLIVSCGSALIAVVFGMSCAYGFARFRFPGRQIGLFGLLLGALLPPTALMTPLFILLSAIGIRTTLLGMMVAYTAFAMPFCVWTMRATFQAIPVELEHAAQIDGASQWGAFWRITLPLAVPSIAIGALLAFLMAYTEFAIGWLFVASDKTVTLAMAISGIVGNSPRFGHAAALALLMAIPVIIVFILLRRLLLRGALMGALPGGE